MYITHPNVPARALPHDVRRIHAGIAAADALIEERRLLYRLAAQLLAPDVAAELTTELLDSPHVRCRIGAALAGQEPLTADALEFARDEFGWCITTETGLRVIADPRARAPFAAIWAALQPESSIEGHDLRLLTEDDGERFTAAMCHVRDGLALARSSGRDLVDDLLLHVDMLALVDPETSAIISASSRYLPGMILIDEPKSALEVAEAIVHEGAHQKFFDLAIMHSFLDEASDESATFEPSWSTAQWPMEQAFAACHAYYCLANFHLGSRAIPWVPPPHDFSLLPRAGDRFAEIAEWLRAHHRDLGVDARRLLGAMTGRAVPEEEPDEPDEARFSVDPGVVVVRSRLRDRLLVGVDGTPPDLFWLDGDAAEKLLRNRIVMPAQA